MIRICRILLASGLIGFAPVGVGFAQPPAPQTPGAAPTDDAIKAKKKQVEDAIKAGRVDDANRLFEELEKMTKPQPPVGEPPMPPMPPKPPLPPMSPREGDKPKEGRRDGDPRPAGPRDGERPPVGRRDGERPPVIGLDLRPQFDRQLKEFDEAIERLKDNPDAKDALEKARGEFKRAMDESLKSAEAMREKMRELKIPGANFEFPAFPPIGEFPQPNIAFNGRLGMLNQPMQSPRLGIQFERVPAVLIEQMGLEKNIGVVVVSVQRDSVAEKAGVKPSDILLQAAGKDVSAEPRQAAGELIQLKPVEKFDLVVLRKGKKEKIEGVILPEQPKRGIEPNGLNRNATMKMQMNGRDVKLTATVNNVDYDIAGDFAAGKFTPGKILIKDGEEKLEAESLEKVPAKYKEDLEKLLNPLLNRGR